MTMDPTTVAQIIDELNHRPAGKIESQTLEFKGWCKDEKELWSEICEAAVCLANADGGLIIIGVDDKKTGTAAITRCPYSTLTADWIKTKIRDFTKPPVQCQVKRMSDLLLNLETTPLGDLFIIDVLKTNHPSGHRTHRGISLVRADTECRTEYLVDNDDCTDVWLDNLTFKDLHEPSLRAGVEKRLSIYAHVKILGQRPIDHLMGIGLVRLREDAYIPEPDSVVSSRAALLLFGKEENIRAEVSLAETVVTIETSITAPFTSSNWYNISEAMQKYVPLINDQLLAREAQLPKDIINELLLNAYLHRCYRTRGPVQIRIRKDEIEFQNPGGLLGGLTAETLIYSPPIYRNFKLTDAARQFGYCEKAGTGIDKVYHLSILNGLDFPIFQSTGNSFTVIVRTKRDEAFVKFIKDFAGGLELSLTDLIVIRVLRSRIEAEIPYLTKCAQRPPDYMENILRDLQRRNIIYQVAGSKYQLTETILNQMGRYDDRGQLKLFQ